MKNLIPSQDKSPGFQCINLFTLGAEHLNDKGYFVQYLVLIR